MLTPDDDGILPNGDRDEQDVGLEEVDVEVLVGAPRADEEEGVVGLENLGSTVLAKSKRPSSGSTALAAHDPLAAYMRDVQRYPLLEPDEERKLAIHYVETGDVDTARRLVTANLRLVVKIAYDYRQAYRNLLDLVQEGNIGLMQAVRKYDPLKGVKLSSYAAWWIRAYMLRYILNSHRLVKLGTTQAQRKLFFNLKKEKARLSAMGIDPTAERIAKSLDVSEEDVEQMDRRLSSGEASLDAEVGTPDGRSISRVELLSSGDLGTDDQVAREEIAEKVKDRVREFGAQLRGKERTIYEQRLVAEEPKTLQELGDDFGVSRERVRQLERRLLNRMRDALTNDVDDEVLDAYGS